MSQEELKELNEIATEIRRCLAFFWEETQTFLEVEEAENNFVKLLDLQTGNRFLLKIEKLKEAK